jgi:DNA-binding MarR family transcriptional regulator
MRVQSDRSDIPLPPSVKQITSTVVDLQPLFSHNGHVEVSATDVWRQLVSLVMDHRGDWRRSVAEATGLPFSRVRALWRLTDRPLTLAELADSMTVDAPAATVAVNDLEQRGLVRRTPHPTNRRAKLVALTDEGLRMVAVARSVVDNPPPSVTALAPAELARLAALLDTINSYTPE